MNVFTKLSPCVPSEVYDEYWMLAHKRQEIFFKRLEGFSPPWTDDPILLEYKFTNAYRASDRVSQFLIREVIYKEEYDIEDALFRILLFKTFNKIETWEYLSDSLGAISYRDFDFKKYNELLNNRFDQGVSIYSGAYIMHSGKSIFNQARKHSNHLLLIDYMMKDGFSSKVEELKNLSQLYDLLLEYPTIGSFLAYQYSIDINYSDITNFEENECVVPGPGAIDGLSKVFSSTGGLSSVDLIKLMCDRQEVEFNRLGIEFKSLWGRDLKLIDCQNLFCEISKYSRISHPHIKGVANRNRIKQKYVPTKKKIEIMYPPKWGINDKIEETYKSNGRNNDQ